MGIDCVKADDDTTAAPLYDLSGRRVITPQTGGVYIQKGKKIIFSKAETHRE
jgi:hypothetical protein